MLFAIFLFFVSGTTGFAEETGHKLTSQPTDSTTSDQNEKANSTVSLTEETDYGTNNFNQLVNGSGTFGGTKDQDPPWSWALGFNFSRSNTPNNGAPNVIDDTRAYNAGLGWTGKSGWGTNVSLMFSATPQEMLESRGGTLTPSYSWKNLGQKKDESFSPSLTLSFNLGTQDFAQKFTGSVPRKKGKTIIQVPINGTNQLRQWLIGPSLEWQALENWKFTLDTKFYAYNRNVGSFLGYLDSPRAVSRGMGVFSGAIGGLPSATYTADITWNFSDAWKSNLNESLSSLAAGSGWSSTTKETLELQFTKTWHASLGAEYDTSASFSGWLGIFGLGADL